MPCGSASAASPRRRSWNVSSARSSCWPHIPPRRSRRAGRSRSSVVADGPREVRQRSWAEVRWRQFRNAPRPVVRAVLASLIVAIVLAAAYLAYDVALARGAALPGGDLRLALLSLYTMVVLSAGTLVTYLIVPQPTGAG